MNVEKAVTEQSWIVTTFDENFNVNGSFIIENQTEADAEVMAGKEISDDDDWTMVPLSEEVEVFIENYGQTEKEMVTMFKLKKSDSVSETATANAYTYYPYYSIYIKDDASMDARDLCAYNYIKSTNGVDN